MRYRIAFSPPLTGKLPQGDPRWGTFNDSFVDTESDPLAIANAIYMGQAYTAWMAGRRRKADHFVCSQWIGVDLDTGDERSSIDYLVTLPLVKTYAAMIHTTPSHTEAQPRARIIFLLSEPIASPDGYKSATTYLASQFDGADTVCTDAARFFYGSCNCRIELILNEMPLPNLRHLFCTWKAQMPPERTKPTRKAYVANGPAKAAQGGVQGLVDSMLAANEGQRNDELNRLAFIAGLKAAEGLTTEAEAYTALTGAALATGLGEREVNITFYSGFRKAAGGVH